MLHYAENAVYQKFQKRRLIPGKYLNADILESTNAKNLEKVFFSSTNKLQPVYIYCLL